MSKIPCMKCRRFWISNISGLNFPYRCSKYGLFVWKADWERYVDENDDKECSEFKRGNVVGNFFRQKIG